MFVNDMPETARSKLVLLAEDALLIEAAKALAAKTEIIVIHNREGITNGVVTKTDVVRQMSTCQGGACQCPVSSVMTRDVLWCHGHERLQDVALRMKARDLKCIPLVDDANRAIGLLTARAILGVLLGDAEHEEDLLVDYVSGVGYR
jgi:CBS domain-containing protein